MDDHVLDAVYAVIRQRQASAGGESYVHTLTQRGLPKVRSKVQEEAGELLEASIHLEHGGPEAAVVAECADLFFHALVLLGAQEIPAEAVWAELRRRFGIGGLVEKAGRKDGGSP